MFLLFNLFLPIILVSSTDEKIHIWGWYILRKIRMNFRSRKRVFEVQRCIFVYTMLYVYDFCFMFTFLLCPDGYLGEGNQSCDDGYYCENCSKYFRQIDSISLGIF